jgi:hypothetical protein
MNLIDCIPKNKFDVEAIARANALGFPALNKVFPQLLEWIQDMNWPVANATLDLLSSAGPENAPQIRSVLNTDDDVWKYWIVQSLIPRMGREIRDELQDVVMRIAYEPSEGERREDVDIVAKELGSKPNNFVDFLMAG